MDGSPAFARIEHDVLRIVTTIPRGKVCTYADLGTCIDVPARHAAYICSRLTDDVRASYPVHHLGNDKGLLPAKSVDAAEKLASASS